MRHVFFLIIVTLALALPAHVMASKEDLRTAQGLSQKQRAVEQRIAFSPAERNLIRSQLLGRADSAPSQNHKDLTPGSLSDLVPGQSLDFHLYRQGKKLPGTLLQLLPKPPAGSEILQIEDKIIRVNARTYSILDVFDLVPTR